MDFTSQLTSRDHNLMLEGDLVIIYERHDSLDYMYLEAGKMLNCKHVRMLYICIGYMQLASQLIYCSGLRRARSITMISSISSSEVKYTPEWPVAGYMR